MEAIEAFEGVISEADELFSTITSEDFAGVLKGDGLLDRIFNRFPFCFEMAEAGVTGK